MRGVRAIDSGRQNDGCNPIQIIKMTSPQRKEHWFGTISGRVEQPSNIQCSCLLCAPFRGATLLRDQQNYHVVFGASLRARTFDQSVNSRSHNLCASDPECKKPRISARLLIFGGFISRRLSTRCAMFTYFLTTSLFRLRRPSIQ